MDIYNIIQSVKDGAMTVDDACAKIRYKPLEDLGYALIDYNRELRTGCPEVIYCEGKSDEHLRGICENIRKNDMKNLLATRCDENKFYIIKSIFASAAYYKAARMTVVSDGTFPVKKGKILVAAAGTSDFAVSEEAAITAEFLGNRVERAYDVGVAGLHRVLGKLDKIREANVIIVTAGMEGALASVVGGLTDKPVIAVPTSVGYGANMGGLSALLSMLNSCAAGVSVVNIDNGFGAGYLANSINKLGGTL